MFGHLCPRRAFACEPALDSHAGRNGMGSLPLGAVVGISLICQCGPGSGRKTSSETKFHVKQSGKTSPSHRTITFFFLSPSSTSQFPTHRALHPHVIPEL
jgi:hypothetical protein